MYALEPADWGRKPVGKYHSSPWHAYVYGYRHATASSVHSASLFFLTSLSGGRNRKYNTINLNNSYFCNWGRVESGWKRTLITSKNSTYYRLFHPSLNNFYSLKIKLVCANGCFLSFIYHWSWLLLIPFLCSVGLQSYCTGLIFVT